MSKSFKVEGFKELENALSQLKQSTAKGVARRVMKKQLEPVAIMANALWPGDKSDVFTITSRIGRRQYKDSEASRAKSTVNMFVGAPGGKKGTPHAFLVEFGTSPRFHKGEDGTPGRFTGYAAPQPMLQPAWDAHKRQVLEGLGRDLGKEIEKTMARVAKKNAGK